jgi:hypothetical protein
VRERLRREALAASSLNHPNICTVYDFLTFEDQYLLVMELVAGQTIHELLRAGPLAPDKAVAVAVQIADALEEAHRNGIVHRDVKSGNVIVTHSGQVKVLDFGLARHISSDDESDEAATEARLTRQGSAVGTLQYMSPEQLLGRPLDGRSDVFSLGVLLHEMLSGKLPFAGQSAAAISDAILHDDPAVPLRQTTVPGKLQDVVLKALEKEPERRYPNAAALAADLRSSIRQPSGLRTRVVYLAYAAAAAAMLALIAGGYVWSKQRSQAKWAREVALPRIEQLLSDDKFIEAARLAQQAAPVLGGDPAMKRLWPRLMVESSIESIPSGADVFLAPYDGAAWEHIGRTPLIKTLLPRGLYHRLRITKDGFAPAVRLWPLIDRIGIARDLRVSLKPAAAVPPRSSFVPGASFAVEIPAFEHIPAVELPDFFIDQYEVSNEEFKRFVDAGGYEKREYWVEPFVRAGRAVPWDQGIKLFVDSTSQPGPSTWELGDYPRDRGSYPVSGVSWYEASAYARFAGKQLPTIFHWTGVAQSQASAKVAPVSNFGGQGPQPTGTRRGLAGFGTYDMAGNVKEWCANAADEPAKRYILGGAWNEPQYMFIDEDAQSAWSRAANFGFRCIKSLGPIPHEAERAITVAVRDYATERPVSDEVFRAYLSAYSYDRTPLEARVVARDSSSEHGMLEYVVMNAAYGNERLLVNVVLPRNARPPYQPVLYFPGSTAISAERFRPGRYDEFVLRSGRALVVPVFKGTWERRDGLPSTMAAPTSLYRDHVVAWGKDLRRTVDYLETRPDMDLSKLSFVGFSWGAAMGPIMAAVEPRIKVCVFLTGGFKFQRPMAEVDQINFAPRVRQPTLMLNARYDQFFPVETSQVPMFRLLGTPEKDKRHIVYDSPHAIPLKETLKESVAWLNHYLGAPSR